MHVTIAKKYRQNLENELDNSVNSSVKGIRKGGEGEHRDSWHWYNAGKKDKASEPLFRLYWFFAALNILIVILGIITLVYPLKK